MNKTSHIGRLYINGGLSEVQNGINQYLGRKYAFKIAKLRYYRQRLMLNAASPPFAIYTVDPDVIKFSIEWKTFRKFVNAGRIVSGKWDHAAQPLSSDEKYSLIRSYLDGEIKSEELTLERLLAHGYPEGEAVKYIRRGYADYLEQLFVSIEKDGFRPQDELSDDNSKRDKYDYVAVDISRDGKLIFDSCGYHRLVIAQVLGLDSIPIRVNAIHGQWRHNHGGAAAHPELTYVGCVPID